MEISQGLLFSLQQAGHVTLEPGFCPKNGEQMSTSRLVCGSNSVVPENVHHPGMEAEL